MKQLIVVSLQYIGLGALIGFGWMFGAFVSITILEAARMTWGLW